MISTKQNGQKVWVTFTYMPEEAAEGVSILGAWNEWQEEPMKLKKSGEYSITKVLKAGSSFEFGYKVDGARWIADENCPKVVSPYASHNSLLEI